MNFDKMLVVVIPLVAENVELPHDCSSAFVNIRIVSSFDDGDKEEDVSVVVDKFVDTVVVGAPSSPPNSKQTQT